MTEIIPIKEGIFVNDKKGARLLANKCEKCGYIFFPKATFCLNCYADHLEDVELSHRGRLYSYTIGYMPSMHFTPPYAIGYIDLPEGVRIFTPLIIDENKPFNVGMELELIIEELWQEDDKRIIGYKFKPV